MENTDSPNPGSDYLDIAVLGGGFAGVACAKACARALRGSGKTVGIVAAENHMVFQPMLPEVVGGALSPRHVVNPVRLLCRGARVLKGEVTGIDLEGRTFAVNAGAFTPDVKFRFGHLVIALGSGVDLRRIPGMTEHAYLVQNVGDAMKLRAAIIARMEEANFLRDRELRRKLLSFVVVGGGYSGVETAGQMVDLLNSVHRYYKNIGKEDFSVSLVHSRDVLLPTLSKGLGDYTADCLRRQGVDLVLGQRVKAVTAQQVTMKSGETLPASLVVSTVGNAPHPVVADLCNICGVENERCRILTNTFFQVAGQKDLWAAGDCAAVPHPEEGLCPPTAQFATRQGDCLGKNLAAVITGKEPRAFAFKGLGELAAIGHHQAVAHIFGRNFSGFFAWWMWRTIYLSKLPGLDRKIRVALEWTLDVFFPRDINLLTPRYSSPVSEMHLEEGDVLYRPGEPAFSFYIVKEGEIELFDGEGKIVRTLGGGEHFGDKALLEGKVWIYKAVAKKSTTLVALSERVFHQLVAASGSIRNVFGKESK